VVFPRAQKTGQDRPRPVGVLNEYLVEGGRPTEATRTQRPMARTGAAETSRLHSLQLPRASRTEVRSAETVEGTPAPRAIRRVEKPDEVF
jgi:hypothetical protein